VRQDENKKREKKLPIEFEITFGFYSTVFDGAAAGPDTAAAAGAEANVVALSVVAGATDLIFVL
jgi:hypothetical protein